MGMLLLILDLPSIARANPCTDGCYDAYTNELELCGEIGGIMGSPCISAALTAYNNCVANCNS